MSGPPPELLAYVPRFVRLYMDTALEHLAECAKAYGLTLRPYDFLQTGAAHWIHNLVGDFYGWRVDFQLITDRESAQGFLGILRAYVLFKSEAGEEWCELGRQDVRGMNDLLTGMQQAAESLIVICGLKLPNPNAARPVV